MRYIELHGAKVPVIGLGTWDLRGEEGYRAVLSALSLGYRHIDTAEFYDNEKEVGRAIRDSGVPRGHFPHHQSLVHPPAFPGPHPLLRGELEKAQHRLR